MNIAFFSTEDYDRSYFDKLNSYNYSISYFNTSLTEDSVALAANHQIVCGFVNDKFSQPVIKSLAKYGVELIALRCAGFNNVDLAEAKSQ